MFGHRFFGLRYFGNPYFGDGGSDEPEIPESVGQYWQFVVGGRLVGGG